MFYGRMEEYTIARPQYTKDRFNHSTVTYSNEGAALIHIVVEDRAETNNNDLNLYTGTLVGYTQNKTIERNWKIGENYIVTSVIPHKNLNVLYLEDIQNGK